MNELNQQQLQTTKFDFDSAVKELLAGKKISGKDGVLAALVKQLVEAALEAEVESHIANDVLSGKPNRRNGYNTKTIKSPSNGAFELSTPRDRESTLSGSLVHWRAYIRLLGLTLSITKLKKTVDISQKLFIPS